MASDMVQLTPKRTKNVRVSVLDMDRNTHGDASSFDADALFDLADKNQDGLLQRDEFHTVHGMMELQSEAAAAKREKAHHEKLEAERSAKSFKTLARAAFAFLLISILANIVIVFAVISSEVRTTSEGALLEMKGANGAIAQTAPAELYAPLWVAPLLDPSVLNQVKSLYVGRLIPVSNGTLGAAAAALPVPARTQYTIIGYDWYDAQTMSFYTARGDILEISEFQAQVVKPDGRKFTTCNADITCSAFSAAGIDVAATVEPVCAADSTSPVRQQLLELGYSGWTCACATVGYEYEEEVQQGRRLEFNCPCATDAGSRPASAGPAYAGRL